LPFKDSRRLGGDGSVLPVTGVALDVVGIELDNELFTGWRMRVERACQLLGWPVPAPLVPAGHSSHTLAFAAPREYLSVAIEVNEWALCATLAARDPGHWSCLRDSLGQGARIVGASGQSFPPPEINEAAAFQRFRRLAGTVASA
jgi:hypothetical protein